MKYYSIANMNGSALIQGCMRMRNLDADQCDRMVMTAMENGINFFDHADIYGAGKSEELFGQVLKSHPGLRDKMIIQSKCAISKGMYDFSKDHILSSVDGSLRRLGVDYLDSLLLHRPDTLMDEEVAEAFDALQSSGKVKAFGVSNQSSHQMKLLQSLVSQPLLFNQLQLSLMHTGMIDAGMHVNMQETASLDHDGGILEHCRLHGVTIQAWSPVQYGFFSGTFLGNAQFPALNQKLEELAQRNEVTPGAIAIAWILRHPARMQVVLGTTNPQRIADYAKAADVTLSRREWYDLYKSAGNTLP